MILTQSVSKKNYRNILAHSSKRLKYSWDILVLQTFSVDVRYMKLYENNEKKRWLSTRSRNSVRQKLIGEQLHMLLICVSSVGLTFSIS